MAEAALMSTSIDAGAELVRALDARHVPVDTAGWIYLTDSEQWKLLLQIGDSDDQSAARVALVTTFAENEAISDGIDLSDVRLVPRSDILVQAVKMMRRTGDEIRRIREQLSYANGIYIPDALIYRNR